MERSAVWMRTSGMTAVAVLDEQERFEGIGRLVRQVMEVAVKPRRGRGTLFMDRATENGAFDPLTRHSLRSCPPSPPQGERGGGGALLDAGSEFGNLGGERLSAGALRALGQAGTPAVHMDGAGGTPPPWDVIPDVEELAAVRGDCDPVGRVCAKLEIAQGKLTTLTKEYSGLNTQELCDVARVFRVKPALRERVMRTALSRWGSPGLAAQMWCLRGGELPKRAEKTARLLRNRGGRRGNCGRQGVLAEKEVASTETIYGPLHDPETPRDYLIEELTVQLMNAVEEDRRAASFDKDAWAVELGFANFSRLRRACVVMWARAPRQIEWELCRDVVRYWIAVESAALFEIAKRSEETAEVMRARWLYQGHEGVVAGTRSGLEWAAEGDPEWVREMGEGLGRVMRE